MLLIVTAHPQPPPPPSTCCSIPIQEHISLLSSLSLSSLSLSLCVSPFILVLVACESTRQVRAPVFPSWGQDEALELSKSHKDFSSRSYSTVDHTGVTLLLSRSHSVSLVSLSLFSLIVLAPKVAKSSFISRNVFFFPHVSFYFPFPFPFPHWKSTGSVWVPILFCFAGFGYNITTPWSGWRTRRLKEDPDEA